MKKRKERFFIIEYLLFWLVPVLKRGVGNKLDIEFVENIPLPRRVTSEEVIPRAIEYWNQKKTLSFVFWKLSKREIIIGLIFSVFSGVSTVVLRPLILGQLISNLENQDDALKNFYSLVAVLLVEAVSFVVVRHAFADIFAHTMFTALAGLIRDKATKLPVTSASAVEIGLIGNDAYRIYENMRFGCLFFLSSIGLLGGIVVLIISLRVSSVTGVSVVSLILLCNMLLGHLGSIAEERDLAAADVRLGILKQMIVGIKALKLCAWEESFLHKILEAREKEMIHLRRFRFFSQMNVQIGRASPITGAAASFLFFVLTDEPVSAEKLFAALNVFLALRLALISLPESVAIIAAARVSLKRIRKYLLQPEIEPIFNKTENKLTQNQAFSMKGGFKWSPESSFQLNLREKMISIEKGKSLAVLSKVGNGKTTFLNSLLGELRGEKSEVALQFSTVAYIPQHPVILGASVKENVTLKTHLTDDEMKLLNKAVDLAALGVDLKVFHKGLDTIIGERGINFSGGQQQRVSIARCFYHCLKNEKDIFIVADDPLSAVDEKVGDELFFEGFMKIVKDQSNTLVMSLNQPKYIKHFDYVLELDNGQVKFFGEVTEENMQKTDILKASQVVDQQPTIKNGGSKFENSSPEESSQENSNENDNLYKKEVKASGVVSLNVIKTYIASIGYCFFFSCCAVGVVTYVFMIFTDFWFTLWVERVENEEANTREDNLQFAYIYSASVVLFLIFLVLTSTMFTIASVKGSRTLHKDAMTNLLRCPVSYFESTPSGRILSRLTSDLSTVDLNLSKFTDNCWQLCMTLLAQVIMVSVLTPPTLVVIVLSGFLYASLTIAVDRCQRVVKREASLAMGPLQLALSETCEGKVLNRLMGYDEYFEYNFFVSLDHWTKFNFTSLSLINFSMLFSGFLSLLISGCTGLYIILSDSLSPARAGLALTYSFLIPYFMQNVGFVVSMLLTSFSSLERLMDYSSRELPQEPEWFLRKTDKTEFRLKSGQIEFKEVTLVYRSGLGAALKNVSFKIESGTKVGLIGRTGAGKSSLIVLLLRLIDPVKGKIYLDNLDIETIGVLELRQNISIIPQTPLLLMGSVLENIAPFSDIENDKNKLEQTIIDSGLLSSFSGTRTAEEVLKLDAQSLSSGQKQLLSLSRCLLNADNKILILDEPTSNVDVITDKKVQTIVKKKFVNTTIITIAHRLNTIVQSDIIIELEQGQVKRIGKPEQILNT